MIELAVVLLILFGVIRRPFDLGHIVAAIVLLALALTLWRIVPMQDVAEELGKRAPGFVELGFMHLFGVSILAAVVFAVKYFIPQKP